MKEETRKKRSKEMKGNKIAEKWTEKEALQLGNELLEWLREPTEENIYFKEFLVFNKGKHHQLVAELSKKFKSFSTLLEVAKEMQEVKLLKYGTLGEYNPTITKFVLINHHGYQDKKVIEDNSEQPLFTIDLNE